MKLRKVHLVAIIFMLLVSGLIYHDSRPELYKYAVSPDNQWSVSVYRQGIIPFSILGVNVIVQVTSNNNIIYNKIIDVRDVWRGVEDRYPELICTNDQIKLGPRFWDGKKRTWFTLQRKDLIK